MPAFGTPLVLTTWDTSAGKNRWRRQAAKAEAARLQARQDVSGNDGRDGLVEFLHSAQLGKTLCHETDDCWYVKAAGRPAAFLRADAV